MIYQIKINIVQFISCMYNNNLKIALNKVKRCAGKIRIRPDDVIDHSRSSIGADRSAINQFCAIVC